MRNYIGAKLYLMNRQEKATIHQLFQDLVDIVIPLGGLKWLNFDDGIIGIAG